MDNSYEILENALPDDLKLWLDEHLYDKKLNTSDRLFKALPKNLQNTFIVAKIQEKIFDIFRSKQRKQKTRRQIDRKEGVHDDYLPKEEVKKETRKLQFPFKSKFAAFLAKTEDIGMEEPEFVEDYSAKNLAKDFKKPNYATQRNSWEMDIMFTSDLPSGKLYLVLININTRYAIIERIFNKSSAEVKRVLNK